MTHEKRLQHVASAPAAKVCVEQNCSTSLSRTSPQLLLLPIPATAITNHSLAHDFDCLCETLLADGTRHCDCQVDAVVWQQLTHNLLFWVRCVGRWAGTETSQHNTTQQDTTQSAAAPEVPTGV